MGYGALVLGAVAVISAVLYFGTVGVLDRETNAKLFAISDRLINHFETRGNTALQQEMQQLQQRQRQQQEALQQKQQADHQKAYKEPPANNKPAQHEEKDKPSHHN